MLAYALVSKPCSEATFDSIVPFYFLFFKNSFILLFNIISASYPVRTSKQISCKIPQFLHRQKLRNNHSLQISAYCPLVIFSRSSGLHSTCVPILPPIVLCSFVIGCDKLFFHSDWGTAASDISCNFVNVFYMNHLDGFCTYGFGRLF